MQSMNEITMGMTPQERATYLEHQAMRAREEQERVKAEIEARKAYKAHLIERILKARPGVWTREELTGKSLSYIERIA